MQYLNRDPRGFEEFVHQFEEHSALGSANTLRGVQGKRPTVYELEKGLRRCKVPLLVVSGDEDDNCLDPGIFIKRVCMSANLLVVPATGHAVNLEEPDLFNRALLDFLSAVDSGRVAAARSALARQIDAVEQRLKQQGPRTARSGGHGPPYECVSRR